MLYILYLLAIFIPHSGAWLSGTGVTPPSQAAPHQSPLSVTQLVGGSQEGGGRNTSEGHKASGWASFSQYAASSGSEEAGRDGDAKWKLVVPCLQEAHEADGGLLLRLRKALAEGLCRGTIFTSAALGALEEHLDGGAVDAETTSISTQAWK